MITFYTSMLGCPEDNGSQVLPKILGNDNGFVDVLKSYLPKQKTLMFITNRWQNQTPKEQPKDEVFNDYHYTNKEYANAVFESFKLSGFGFDKLIVVDCDYKGDFEKDLSSSELVFIQGGHTPRGLKILKDLHFDKYAKEYNGVVIFTGTSAKLPASKVLSTHHGSKTDYEVEEGLSLKDYSVRPHFNFHFKLHFDKKFKVRIELLKDFSKHIDVYAIAKNSFIVDDNKQKQIYGTCFRFKNKRMKKICQNNKKFNF